MALRSNSGGRVVCSAGCGGCRRKGCFRSRPPATTDCKRGTRQDRMRRAFQRSASVKATCHLERRCHAILHPFIDAFHFDGFQSVDPKRAKGGLSHLGTSGKQAHINFARNCGANFNNSNALRFIASIVAIKHKLKPRHCLSISLSAIEKPQ
jgi:hypothetical protein